MIANEPIELGSRIVVWGVTGSGKTSMAGLLGERFGLSVVELDAIRHANGWDSTDFPEMRTILEQYLDASTDGWVLDGSYSVLHDTYLRRADTLIWLHLPWRVSFWRLFKRTIRRAWTREPLYNAGGPRESWRMTFLSRRSILWWSISMHGRATQGRAERITALPRHIRSYELRSSREVRDFLTRLPVREATRILRQSSRSDE